MGKHPRLVKGLSVEKRDLKMSELISRNNFIETDFSRFDMSVSAPILRTFEHYWLVRYFDNPDSEYLKCLHLLLHTEGVSDIGLAYSVDGTRCSGDAHTSIGNGLLNDFLTWLCVGDDVVHFHEGDDGVIGVDDDELDQVIYNMHLIPVLGFMIKIDIYSDLHQVSFCGRFLYHHAGRINSYCDVKRTLAKFHTICSDGDAESLLLAKSMSLHYSDHDTPIIGVLTGVLIQLLEKRVSDRRLKRAKQHLLAGAYAKDIIKFAHFSESKPSGAIRAAVALRCGYNPNMQLAYENYYKGFLQLGYLPEVIHRIPDEWDFDELSHVHGQVQDFVC